MVRLLGLVVLVLWVWSLAESLLSPRDEIRLLPKLAWVAVIVLLGPLGAIGWLALGRPRRDVDGATIGRSGHPGRPGHPGHPGRSERPERPRPVRGPDDDPDFLRGL